MNGSESSPSINLQAGVELTSSMQERRRGQRYVLVLAVCGGSDAGSLSLPTPVTFSSCLSPEWISLCRPGPPRTSAQRRRKIIIPWSVLWAAEEASLVPTSFALGWPCTSYQPPCPAHRCTGTPKELMQQLGFKRSWWEGDGTRAAAQLSLFLSPS